MNDHIPVILNPAARSARAGERLEMIRALSPQVEIHATNGAGDARRMARELAAAGARIVVAAGGDGTVNEVTNGLADAGPSSTAALGILPNGTMNVFANDLGLPAHRMDECWAIIASGRVREIDLWKANDTHFAQLAGVGFDAAVIGNVTWESKKRLGPLSYVKSLLELLKRGSPELTITARLTTCWNSPK